MVAPMPRRLCLRPFTTGHEPDANTFVLVPTQQDNAEGTRPYEVESPEAPATSSSTTLGAVELRTTQNGDAGHEDDAAANTHMPAVDQCVISTAAVPPATMIEPKPTSQNGGAYDRQSCE